MILSKIIPREAAGKVQPWRAPELGKQGNSKGISVSSNRDEKTQLQYENAKQEGFEQGYAAGLQQAVDDLSANRKQLTTLFQSLVQPLDHFNDAVEQELLELSLAVARQILRRELTADPRHIIGLIRQAITQLPSASRNIRIHLHPEDAAVVRDTLGQNEDAQRWRLEDDATLHRGTCHVHTDTSFMDAGIDALINRLSLEMLGGMRETDIKEAEDANIESG